MSDSMKSSRNAVEQVKNILGKAAEEIVSVVSENMRRGLVENLLGSSGLSSTQPFRPAATAAAPVSGKTKGMPFSKRPMTAADRQRAALHGRYVGLVAHARNATIKAQAKKIYEADGIDKAIAFLARAKLGKVTVVKAGPAAKKPAVKKVVAKKAAPHKNGVRKPAGAAKKTSKKTVKKPVKVAKAAKPVPTVEAKAS